MKSGDFVLMILILAVWAELPSVSGRNIPEFCMLPKDRGPCHNEVYAFYYNSTTETCEVFFYGGCQGNDNLFFTKQECLRVCGETEFCRLPMDQGPCRGDFDAYYYNSTTKTCEMFIYGGCQGNDNLFFSKEECLRVCGETGTVLLLLLLLLLLSTPAY
ncbi:kunitz-type serine protease inhibitor vestiginin-3-like [Hemicordylus capensis]|uniref:kunitz-type serine protease inhibitor vestiginin-3-like n=1 Tax=Hemicordylus capensis TaxID=884348 RepID=UPI002302713C|nr:kunitz-type serine protease inhibitor vestiginin-3-like [Hemicordylus capensis]